jgi:hypothetical protein
MNNILYNLHSWHGSISIDKESLTGMRSDYNVVMDRLSPDDDNTVMKLTEWTSSTGQDAHSIPATPEQLFADVAAGNFRSKAGSPAIDAGTPENAPTADILGITRPVNSKHDIGAYEFTSSAVLSRSNGIAGNVLPHIVKRRANSIAVDVSGRIVFSRQPSGKNRLFQRVILRP